MPVNDELGKRMKEFYEAVPKTRLVRRMPVAIRIDGKAFHTFTKGFQKPFDEVLGNAMARTMEYLCRNIQGCVFGYTQSDEITLILIDYQTLDTDAWFGYEVQKMCSIAASMATMAFNRIFKENARDWLGNQVVPIPESTAQLFTLYSKAAEKGAMFDARCFNIPKEEVTNLIYWRQLDATRNSIQMVGQANFSHSELQGKSCNMIQEMLHEQKNINWNDYPTRWKRGVACYKVKESDILTEPYEGWAPNKEVQITRTFWKVDYEMPILRSDGREYVDKCVYVGE